MPPGKSAFAGSGLEVAGFVGEVVTEREIVTGRVPAPELWDRMLPLGGARIHTNFHSPPPQIHVYF